MERLTERVSENIIELSAKANPIQYNGYPQRVHIKHQFWNVFNKLCNYEDAEEQGLLLRLPCTVGDRIYRFWYVGDTPYRIQEQTIKKLSQVVAIMEDDSFGKTVFLTKAEAEQVLAEMKRGK